MESDIQCLPRTNMGNVAKGADATEWFGLIERGDIRTPIEIANRDDTTHEIIASGADMARVVALVTRRGPLVAMNSRQVLILAFPEYLSQSRQLAEAAGIELAEVAIHRFPDGESLVRLPAALPPELIFCRSLDRPNTKLIELELAAAAALEQGAKRLTLVAPYLCYMRQDRAFHAGEAVSQRIIGELLARRFDGLITVDPHLHRTHELGAAVPVRRARALSASGLMSDWLAGREDRPLLLGPDEESAQWVSAIAAPLNLDYGVARKRRTGDRNVSVELPELDFGARHVVLVDDVVSTGRTLAECATELRVRGVTTVTALVTHALFADDALAELRSAGVDSVVSTDSIPHESNRLPLGRLLAGAVNEIFASS